MTDTDYKLEAAVKEFYLVHRWRLNKAASECGLYPGQPSLIFHLMRNEECTQKELADILMVTPASVTVSVRRLEKAGIIKRHTDETDLRCNRLSLTEKGIECGKICMEALDSVNRRAYEGMSDKDKEEAERILKKMTGNLKST